jgi:hypothetical protein
MLRQTLLFYTDIFILFKQEPDEIFTKVLLFYCYSIFIIDIGCLITERYASTVYATPCWNVQ